MAIGAEPMKHLVPELAELLPDHPALLVRLLRRWLSGALARGLVSARQASRVDSVRET